MIKLLLDSGVKVSLPLSGKLTKVTRQGKVKVKAISLKVGDAVVACCISPKMLPAKIIQIEVQE